MLREGQTMMEGVTAFSPVGPSDGPTGFKGPE